MRKLLTLLSLLALSPLLLGSSAINPQVNGNQGGFQGTDPTTFSMVISAVTTAPTRGTGVTEKATWSRFGKWMLIKYDYRQTGAGSAGSGTYLFTLPGGYSIDTSVITPSTTASQAILPGAGQSYSNNSLQVWAYDSTHIALLAIPSASGVGNVNAVASGYSGLDNATQYYSFYAWVPISGLSSTSPQGTVPYHAAHFGGSGTDTSASACSSGSCTIYNGSGWLSGVTWNATGTYTLNFVSGTFSHVPNCVMTKGLNGTSGNFGGLCVANTYSTSSQQIICRDITNTNVNSDWFVTCTDQN